MAFLPDAQHGFCLVLALCMVWVIVSDATRYIISNRLNLLIVVLYAIAAFFLPTEPLWAVAAAGAIFAVGLGLFALGLMGGGDIKLLIALSLWTGWDVATVSFLMLTAIGGGLLVIIVLLLRVILPPVFTKFRPDRPLPRLLTRKQPVPYGIAIAAAFLWLLAMGGVPMLAS